MPRSGADRWSATWREISYGTAAGAIRPLQPAADGHDHRQHHRAGSGQRGARSSARRFARAGEAPRGVTVNVRGQVPPMNQTLSGLQLGLLLAVVGDLSAARGELPIAPRGARGSLDDPGRRRRRRAGVCGSRGTTLNVQSFMGAIMAIGVSVANAILLVTFAEQKRRAGLEADTAAMAGATSRLRPILMTSFAMIAGMIPMALGDWRRRRADRAIGPRRDRRAGGVNAGGADGSAAGLRHGATQRQSRFGVATPEARRE